MGSPGRSRLSARGYEEDVAPVRGAPAELRPVWGPGALLAKTGDHVHGEIIGIGPQDLVLERRWEARESGLEVCRSFNALRAEGGPFIIVRADDEWNMQELPALEMYTAIGLNHIPVNDRAEIPVRQVQRTQSGVELFERYLPQALTGSDAELTSDRMQ